MKVERNAPWLGTIDYTLARIVRADVWALELKRANGEHLAGLAGRGDVEARFPGFRRALAKLATSAETQRRSFVWVGQDIADRDVESDTVGARSLFLFICPVPTGELLTGGVVLDRAVLAESAFQNEAELLGFLTGLAASVARERKVAEERWAMQRLLSSLAIQCAVVTRTGRLIFETTRSAVASGSTNNPCEQSKLPLKGMINQILAKYRSAQRSRGRSDHVAIVDRGSRKTVPVYVLPISKDEAESDAEYLALLLPRPTQPLSDEALAAALSLPLAEAKVVRHIMVGRRIRDIAERMSVTELTVRTYLKRTYAKLGVSGQCELIAKVSELSIPLGSRPQQS